MLPKISIVIPIYNEEKVINKTLQKILSLKINGELILIDDGSSDNTVNIIKEIIKKNKNKNIKINLYIKDHSGYGGAIIYGLKRTIYNTILLTDGDGEHDISSLSELIEYYHNNKNNYVAVIGARNIKYSTIKKLYGKLFHTLIKNHQNGDDIVDIISGTRIFSKDTLNKLDLRQEGWLIMIEMNFQLVKLGKIGNFYMKYNPRSIEEGKKFIGIVKKKFLLQTMFFSVMSFFLQIRK